jgi:hypothetical protein
MASAAPGDGVQNEPLAMYPCGQLPPGPGGFGTGKGSRERRRRDEREHEGKGYFHWVDLCLGHYWDTVASCH